VNTNGKVKFYEFGTTTAKPVYQDQAKAAKHGGTGGNEVTLDANGRLINVWADGVYKVVIENALGGVEYTIDRAVYGFSVVDARRDFGVISVNEDSAYDDGNLVNSMHGSTS